MEKTRAEIITALRLCSTPGKCECDKCPYSEDGADCIKEYGDGKSWWCADRVAQDAAAMLDRFVFCGECVNYAPDSLGGWCRASKGMDCYTLKPTDGCSHGDPKAGAQNDGSK